MRKTLVLTVILVLAAANAFAGAEARMNGKVTDGVTKKPLGGVVIRLEAIEGKTVKHEIKSKPDGSYAVYVLDGTIRYKFSYMMEGYVPYIEVVKLKIGETTTKDVELLAGQVAAASNVIETKADPSVEAYNEGAALSNAGDLPGALAKFEQAVQGKPDLLAGWAALGKTHYKMKNYAKAVEAAKKVIDVDDSDGDMWSLLHACYVAMGDKANAAIAEKKVPANAGTLFNEAARQINAGNDVEAEKLLRQAIAMDDKFSAAYYEFGMLLVRSGKNAEAKDALNKYLELDPKGKDAATAKEMLTYLK